MGAFAALGVRLEEDVEQRGDGGIGLCGAHRGPARGAGVRVYRRGGRGLEGEPLLQTGAAEGVQAVEQRERLVEHVGTDLAMAELAAASSSCSSTYRARQFLFQVALDSASALALGHGSSQTARQAPAVDSQLDCTLGEPRRYKAP